MSDNQIVSRKAIVSVDPYSLHSYRYHHNEISINDIKRFDKKDFYISYVQTKDIISSTIEISRSVPEEDLKDAIEVKAYDELGLEGEVEYSIYYFESNKQDEEERIFNIIAVDTGKLNTVFQDMDGIKYIDYMTAAPFLLKSLYHRNILEPTQTDCFIYFQEDDAFIAIYQNGDYLFSKSIRYSLKVISDTFAKNLGKRFSEDEFYKILTKEGLKNSNVTYQQQLMKLLGEVFLYINDVILFAKRAYHIDNIDCIYIGSQIGNISGIEEFCNSYLNIEAKLLKFNIAKNSNEIEYDQIHTLMTLTAVNYINNKDENLNLTIFKRPPPFIYRPSGKLMQVLAASVILSFAYPAYQLGYNYYLEEELKTLNSQHKVLSKQANDLRQKFAQGNKKKKDIESKLAEKEKELTYRTTILHEIYKKKVDYPMKAKILTELFSYVNKHHSKVVKVENKDREMLLTVQSDADKHITEFMKDLADFKKYNISTELIQKDDNKSTYLSAVKVELYGKFE